MCVAFGFNRHASQEWNHFCRHFYWEQCSDDPADLEMLEDMGGRVPLFMTTMCDAAAAAAGAASEEVCCCDWCLTISQLTPTVEVCGDLVVDDDDKVCVFISGLIVCCSSARGRPRPCPPVMLCLDLRRSKLCRVKSVTVFLPPTISLILNACCSAYWKPRITSSSCVRLASSFAITVNVDACVALPVVRESLFSKRRSARAMSFGGTQIGSKKEEEYIVQHINIKEWQI